MTPRIKCIENLRRVTKFLESNDTIDLFLIQEIDKDSKRSYHMNEYDTVVKDLKKFLLSEYEKGNYIITGGDWNQSPPDFKSKFTGNIVNTKTTTTTVIDLFLLSPNIKDISVECLNLHFENSDHNPVRIKVKQGMAD